MYLSFLLRVFFTSAIVSVSLSKSLRETPKPYSAFLATHPLYPSIEDFYASGARCRTLDLTEDEVAERNRDMAAFVAMPEATGPVRIKVYFQVITSSHGDGTLSARTIKKQMGAINHAYRGTRFRFELADTIVTSNDRWFTASTGSSAETEMKNALRSGTYQDLNIYTTVQANLNLGWSTYPANVGPMYRYDGVVVDYRTLPGDDFAPYNLGITSAHEIGHWLGLQHTFNGGCNPDGRAGDLIGDTPAEASANYGCPASRNSCPGNTGALAGDDPIHNFMDYSDDACMDHFTNDQRTRMVQQWYMYRSNK